MGRRLSGWRRALRRTTWTVVWSLVIAAGWYWWTPWGKDFRLERRIESLCGGVLDAGQMLDLAEDPDEDGRPDTDVDDIDEGADGRWEECGVGDINIVVADIPDWPDRAEDIHSIAVPRIEWPIGGLAAPLGSGWSGYITRDTTVTAALPCTGAADRHIVVEVSDDRLGDWYYDKTHALVDDADKLLPVARAATDIATRAADEWDCQTTPGRRLTEVPQPVSWEGDKPLAQADGTCARLPFDRDERTARVWETGTDPDALVEYCDGPTPDAAPAGCVPHGSTGLWASARCPGTNQRALYEISLIPIDEKPREDGGEVSWWDEEWPEEGRMAPEALAAFAQQSADRHGCTDLRLP